MLRVWNHTRVLADDPFVCSVLAFKLAFALSRTFARMDSTMGARGRRNITVAARRFVSEPVDAGSGRGLVRRGYVGLRRVE